MSVLPLAVVTGASSGLGQALCQMLSSQYRIVGLGRNVEGLEATRAKIPEAFRSTFVAMPWDLTNVDQLSTCIHRCRAAFPDYPEVELLLNVAGASAAGPVEEIPLDQYEQIWRLCFLAPVSLTQQCLKSMKARGAGQIVNVTSGVGFRALPYISPYSAAKAALNAFTDSLRVELAGTSIRLLLFSPGPTATRFLENKKIFGKGQLRYPKFHGQPPMEIAALLVKALRAGEKTRVIGLRANLARILQFFSPRLTDWTLRRTHRWQ